MRIQNGVTTAQVLEAHLYKVPQYVVWSFPIAAVIAAVFTVHAMTTHQEIVAAKAGGISFHRLFAPVLILGVLMTGAALYLTEGAPKANNVTGAFGSAGSMPLGMPPGHPTPSSWSRVGR